MSDEAADPPADAPAGAPPPSEMISIPVANFIEDVGKHLDGRTGDAAIQTLNEQYQTYVFVEQNLMRRKASLMAKLPDIHKTLDAVLLLQKRREADESVLFDFELGNSVWGKAKIPPTKAVNLWLGADVMVEYPIDEAQQLLETNLKNCKANMSTTDKDLATIREFKTTTEVNIARIYNHDIAKKKGSVSKPVAAASSAPG